MMEKEKFISERINLHIAEYNALTTRCTSFINFQFVLLGALIAWFSLGIFLWDKENADLSTWGILTGAQVLEMVAAWNLYEQYVAINYMEKHLRPAISTLIENNQFWEYESVIALGRKHKIYKQAELFGLIFFLVLIVTAFVCRCVYTTCFWIDLFGFTLNVVIWVIVARKTFESLKIKRGFLPQEKRV